VTTVARARVCDPRLSPLIGRRYRKNCHYILQFSFGFGERVSGSHHIFFKQGVEEILDLRPKGGKAKPYQVKQVRHVVLKYRLGGAPDAEA